MRAWQRGAGLGFGHGPHHLRQNGRRAFNDDQLDWVNGGAQTDITEQRNNGGNVPNGNANGVPEVVVVVENPLGKRPPGQQP